MEKTCVLCMNLSKHIWDNNDALICNFIPSFKRIVKYRCELFNTQKVMTYDAELRTRSGVMFNLCIRRRDEMKEKISCQKCLKRMFCAIRIKPDGSCGYEICASFVLNTLDILIIRMDSPSVLMDGVLKNIWLHMWGGPLADISNRFILSQLQRRFHGGLQSLYEGL